jgi:hypothetical protein
MCDLSVVIHWCELRVWLFMYGGQVSAAVVLPVEPPMRQAAAKPAKPTHQPNRFVLKKDECADDPLLSPELQMKLRVSPAAAAHVVAV